MSSKRLWGILEKWFVQLFKSFSEFILLTRGEQKPVSEAIRVCSLSNPLNNVKETKWPRFFSNWPSAFFPHFLIFVFATSFYFEVISLRLFLSLSRRHFDILIQITRGQQMTSQCFESILVYQIIHWVITGKIHHRKILLESWNSDDLREKLLSFMKLGKGKRQRD